MFLVNDPGPWQNFVLRGDNIGRPITEVTQKYLHEQLQFENFISMQQQLHLQQFQNKGIDTTEISNYITNIAFGGDDLETISGFNNAQVVVTFAYDVNVTGTPFIEVDNELRGAGSDTTIPYNYSSGDGTDTLTFVYQQSASVVNTPSAVGAYVLETTYSGVPTTFTNTLTGDITPGTYTNITGSWASGSVTGDTSGKNITCSITIGAANAVTNISNFSTSGPYFTPGNTILIRGTLLSGSGNYVFTIEPSMLRGDLNKLSGTSINLNGGSISNVDGGSINIAYTSTATKTAVAT